MAVFNGTTSNGTYQGAALLSTPFTVAGWFYHTANQTVEGFGFADNNSNVVNALIGQHNGLGRLNRNAFNPGILAGVFNLSAWNSVVGVFVNGAHELFINGASAGTDATAVVNQSYPDIAAGFTGGSAPAYWTGKLAHLSIHSSAFALADAQDHNSGVLPSALPNPWAWFPLLSNGSDLVGGRNLTLTDVTFDGSQPSVISYSEASGTKLFVQSLARGLSSPLSGALNQL
jgi:hypothetical protein